MATKPTALITGVSGFVGPHAAREFIENGYRVIGVGNQHQLGKDLYDLGVEYLQCDLTDPAAVAKLPIKSVDVILNLAGLAKVGGSDSQRDEYLRVNVDILKNLVDSTPAKTRTLAVSTGALYDTAQQPPFNEQSATVSIDAGNAYTESKLLMEAAARDYQAKGANVVVVRPFNHIGPGQLPGFLVPDLAAQLQQAQASGGSQIEVGDLTKQRDYTDVRDVARAYRLLAQTEELPDKLYNIASGHAVSGQQILNLLQTELGFGDLKVVVDPARLRPHDPPILYGDHTALTKDTGWQPTIPLEQTISDFVGWFKTS